MTDWDKEFDKKDEADVELEKDKAEMTAFPEDELEKAVSGKAWKEISKLLSRFKKSVNKNEKKKILQAMGGFYSGKLLKVIQKTVIPLALLCLLTVGARADMGTPLNLNVVEGTTSEIEVNPMIDFKSLLKNTRTGFFINQHMDRFIGVYTSLQRFHFADKIEIANINGGYLKREDIKDGSPLFSLSGRLDNLIYRSWQGKWGKAHVTTSNLPTIEFGPWVSPWLETVDGKLRLDAYYGLSLAIGF